MAREVKLTKAGYERLMQQLERERERLQEATKILQELMESSDDYDDSGLEAAKQEKARIEARIDSLEDILSRAVILEEGSWEVIGRGSVVELEDPLSGERLSVQVVSPAEANVLDTPMKISDASPMGKALLGHRVGDVLPLDTPKGKREVRVVAVHGGGHERPDPPAPAQPGSLGGGGVCPLPLPLPQDPQRRGHPQGQAGRPP